MTQASNQTERSINQRNVINASVVETTNPKPEHEERNSLMTTPKIKDETYWTEYFAKQEEAQKRWRAKNPDKVKQYNQDWRERNPERVKAIRSQYNKRRWAEIKQAREMIRKNKQS